jgi:hypothetical protein
MMGVLAATLHNWLVTGEESRAYRTRSAGWPAFPSSPCHGRIQTYRKRRL